MRNFSWREEAKALDSFRAKDRQDWLIGPSDLVVQTTLTVCFSDNKNEQSIVNKFSPFPPLT